MVTDQDDYHDEEQDDDESVDVNDAEVWCPYCGERASITIDRDGGGEQDYVEDCPVCCRPWSVHVSFSASGKPHVTVEEAQ